MQLGAGAASDGGTALISEREVAAVPIAANPSKCVTFAIVLFMIYLLWDLRLIENENNLHHFIGAVI